MKEVNIKTKIILIIYAIVQIFIIAMAIIYTFRDVSYTAVGVIAAILGFVCFWFGIRHKFPYAVILGVLNVMVVIQNLVL